MKQISTIQQTCPLCPAKTSDLLVENYDYGHKSCINSFSYVKCSGCGHIYLKNRPSPEEICTIYPEDYTAYNIDKEMGFLARTRDLVQFNKLRAIKNKLSPDAHIVEIGCGTGSLLKIIQKYGKKSWTLCGIEMSEKGQEALAKLNIPCIPQQFEKIEGWPYQKADLIIMNQVIEHLDNPSFILEKIWSILKPNGYLFIETPSIEAWDAKIVELKYWGGWHTPRHFHIFTQKTLNELLSKKNFNVLKVRYIFSPFLWTNTLKFWVEHKIKSHRIANFFHLGNPFALIGVSIIDLLQLIFSKKTSNMRIISQKADI